MKKIPPLLAGVAIAMTLASPVQSQTPETLRVFIPNDHNLQWMNFWVAKGAGLFADEGLRIEIILPNSQGGGDGRGGGGGRGRGGGGGNGSGGRGSGSGGHEGGGPRALVNDSAHVAVMPRPTFLQAVGEAQPVVAFANLLANDPINLVVQGDIARERGLTSELPLVERLEGIRGLRVGVAPGPPPRLRALFRAAGMDADSDIEIMLVPGPAQNLFFEQRQVDALYAHTPYLEKALVDQGAIMIVNQSAGEIEELANRQIHMLVTSRIYADAHPEVIESATRAIYRAQQLIHSDLEATIGALRVSGLVLKEPGAIETLVEIYQPAMPRTPAVSADGALRELALNSAHRVPPDLSGIDMNDYVDNRFVRAAVQGN